MRKYQIKRKTKETEISIQINLDGTGKATISTGNGFLDHLLNQISRHGLIDLNIKAIGDIETGWHHTVEDVGISLGFSKPYNNSDSHEIESRLLLYKRMGVWGPRYSIRICRASQWAKMKYASKIKRFVWRFFGDYRYSQGNQTG